jgi:hypothetical protein
MRYLIRNSDLPNPWQIEMIVPLSHRLASLPPTMAASGTNPHLLRLQVHNRSGTSSPHDSHPGTPWREDDEHTPLLRPGDIDRTA